MGRHDWYRNKTWDAEVEEAFEAKFARTRQPWSRWQYLTIQAGMLRRPHPEVAKSLYERSMELKGVEEGWVASSLQSLGQLALMRGDREAAVARLRESVDRCPSDKRTMRGSKTAEELLVQLLWFTGDEGRAEATTYLRPPPPDWGEIPEVPEDPGGHPYASPDDAAESLVVAFHVTDQLSEEQVDALFAADPLVLSAFDDMLLEDSLGGVFYRWFDHGRWELPGYIGRCLVKQCGAQWVPADHIKDWRMEVGGRAFDLYPTIWTELHRGVPIRGIYEQLRAGPN